MDLCGSWVFLVSFSSEILMQCGPEKGDISGTYAMAQLTDALGERTARQSHNQVFPATKHADA